MDYGLLMIDCCVQAAAAHLGALKMTPPEHQVSDSRRPTPDHLIPNPYYSQLLNYAKQSQFFLTTSDRNLLFYKGL
jgi:hypothetical protein